MTYEWQYNGVAPWSEIVGWCTENFGIGGRVRSEWFERWYVDWETIYFEYEEDYIFFILRWM